MKVSVAALVFVLSMACCSQASIEEKSFAMSWGMMSDSCFSYTSRQIPRRIVTAYFVTSRMCSQPAVVFITKKDHKICTNPKDAWVQQYVNDLKQSVSGDRQ
ncbi:C-C motif chemokine 3-like [Chrysemys picta bellii]|uniref:C-C motif chemokine 3-like n=1 Tax=Chrysemys picta bellii TaxID=8478 RepID=UPI000CE6527A|nr:C-C motif chemokine 3-like isoform X1 [Chrysemys picta bellii]